MSKLENKNNKNKPQRIQRIEKNELNFVRMKLDVNSKEFKELTKNGIEFIRIYVLSKEFL